MDNEFVFFNGIRMIAGWPERIQQAQLQENYLIAGREVARVRYGGESGGWDPDASCHDCRVVKGQLHVPGCDVEECPRCRGQVITCDCPYDEEE